MNVFKNLMADREGIGTLTESSTTGMTSLF